MTKAMHLNQKQNWNGIASDSKVWISAQLEVEDDKGIWEEVSTHWKVLVFSGRKTNIY